MISQFFINLLLIAFLSLNNYTDAVAQEKLKFGLNAPYNNPLFYKTVTKMDDYENFFRDYNVRYLRFPGGSVVRFFIYNSSSLTNQAKTKIFDYYRTRGKERALEKSSEGDNAMDFPDDYYETFLKFCAKNKVEPIITLNTCYYGYNNTLYQVAPFVHSNKQQKEEKQGKQKNQVSADEFNNNGMNDKLRQSLIDQMNLAHKYVQKVAWEIGNEENYMHSADVEAEIVKFYVGVIKSVYPQDEIIASFVNTFGEQKKTGGEKKNRGDYAADFINNLNEMNLLPQINYFAPHFYVNVDEPINSEQDLQQRLRELDFAGFEREEISYFPKNYKPHFFITEFAIFLGQPHNNINYNSNLHALMFFYFLSNFYASSSIDGVIYHSFLGKAPFVFLEPDAQAFNNNIANKNSGYKNVSVIPLQVQAEQAFFKNVGQKFIKLVKEGDVSVLVTQTGNKYIYIVINPTQNDVSIDKKKIMESLPDDADLALNTYDFHDLNSKNNVPVSQAAAKKYRDLSTLQIKKYSVTIIK